MKEDYTTVWGFKDKDEGYILPPGVGKFFSSRWEARHEKKKYPIYYECTTIIKCKITPFTP